MMICWLCVTHTLSSVRNGVLGRFKMPVDLTKVISYESTKSSSFYSSVSVGVERREGTSISFQMSSVDRDAIATTAVAAASAATTTASDTDFLSPHFNSQEISFLRGILNVTGTACHVNAALIVLGHALRPLATAIIHAASHSPSEETTSITRHTSTVNNALLLFELGSFLQELMCNEADKVPHEYDAIDPTQIVSDILRNDQNNSNKVECERNLTSPVDPSRLYKVLRATIGLEPNDLGDAVTALIQLLNHVAANSKAVMLVDDESVSSARDLQPGKEQQADGQTDLPLQSPVLLLPRLLDNLLDSGRTFSLLTGRQARKSGSQQNSNTESSQFLVQTKRLKERRLFNPFPLPMPPFLKFVEVLRLAFCESHPVQQYNWPALEAVKTENGDRENGNEGAVENSTEWITSKRTHVTSFPPIFMFHLQRRELVSNQQIEDCDGIQGNEDGGDSTNLEIPFNLDLDPYLSSEPSKDATAPRKLATDCTFELTGVVFHVSDDAGSEEDEEDGHYAAAVIANNQWFIVDDDTCLPVSVDQVLQWASGDYWNETTDFHKTVNDTEPNKRDGLRSGSFLRGILLIYHRNDLSLISVPYLRCTRMDSQQLKSANSPDTNGPFSLPSSRVRRGSEHVGRQLRVLWSDSMYYAGTVTSFNKLSKKHTVTYDDGDVREYNLSKKTVQWLDE